MLNNKPLLYLTTALFTIGASALIAIWSFSGMLYLSHVMVAAVTSAILAVLIEGEIYKQNIFKGMGMLLQMGKFLENNHYTKALDELASTEKYHLKMHLLKKSKKELEKQIEECFRLECNAEEEALLEQLQQTRIAKEKHLRKIEKAMKKAKDEHERYQKCALLRDYQKVCQHLAALKEIGILRMTQEQRRDYALAEMRKADMENFFMRYLKGQLDPNNPTESVLEAELNLALGDQAALLQKNIQKQIRREKMWLWASAPITLLGGAAAMFVTASQLSSAFVSFGIAMTPAIMGGAVWPLAGIAAIGYMLMIYKTFVDIIHNKRILNFWNNFKIKFEAASTPKKVLYVTGMALVIGLALAATIASAGTWWNAAQAGLALIPILSAGTTVLKTVLSSIGVAMMGIGIMLFDYGNSLESLETIANGLPKKGKIWSTIRKKTRAAFETWNEKELAEKINPFKWLNKIVEIPFRLVMFIGHLISIGVTGDNLADLNPAITATIGSLQEGLTDVHYIWENASDHHHNHDDHHCHEHHGHAHAHDHVHSDLAGFFLNIFMSPVKLLSATWNKIFSPRKASFLELLKEEFSIAKKQKVHKPELSSEWQYYEADHKLGNEIVRLSHAKIGKTLSLQKQAVMEEKRDELRGVSKSTEVPPAEDVDMIEVPLLKKDVLGTHRNHYWFKKKPTTSQKLIDDIIRECPSARVAA